MKTSDEPAKQRDGRWFLPRGMLKSWLSVRILDGNYHQARLAVIFRKRKMAASPGSCLPGPQDAAEHEEHDRCSAPTTFANPGNQQRLGDYHRYRLSKLAGLEPSPSLQGTSRARQAVAR